MMAEQLSGVTVVLFIGGGVLTFILLFVFAKRQIMRFALRGSRRGPHVPIGHDCRRSMRREIDKMIEAVPKIQYEPTLIRTNEEMNEAVHVHHYKMKAVDSSKLLEREISEMDQTMIRHSYEPLRSFLVNYVFGGLLSGQEQRVVNEYCDLYELARYDPQEFGARDYEAFCKLQGKLVEIVRTSQYFGAGKKTSPCRTPVKKPKPKKKCGSPKMSQRGSAEDETALCVEDHAQKDADPDSKHETTV